jgi:hypothetical protein
VPARDLVGEADAICDTGTLTGPSQTLTSDVYRKSLIKVACSLSFPFHSQFSITPPPLHLHLDLFDLSLALFTTFLFNYPPLTPCRWRHWIYLFFDYTTLQPSDGPTSVTVFAFPPCASKITFRNRPGPLVSKASHQTHVRPDPKLRSDPLGTSLPSCIPDTRLRIQLVEQHRVSSSELYTRLLVRISIQSALCIKKIHLPISVPLRTSPNPDHPSTRAPQPQI